MPELIFFTGPMECGKSTLALQVDYTQTQAGRAGRVFTCRDRSGEARIASRIGLSRPAIEVSVAFDFWAYVLDQLVTGHRVDYLVCDEAQFFTADQIDQLARIVDELRLDVFCFGILTDFRTRLFPGSARLVELCDRMELLQVKPLCWCGRPATHNARTIGGEMVTDGEQVEVGDTSGEGPVRYEVLCRRHHRSRVTAARAQAGPTPDPLPLEVEEDAMAYGGDGGTPMDADDGDLGLSEDRDDDDPGVV
ncbi:thymidine kinase [Propionicicella superfundia]|uniref:thymidine kinase n=1 Tax=Propionicicella superfundia TaxID=348582 RepID=UPI0009FE8FB3